MQFLTLNMDENPGLIAPFLTEHQLSLIVLPAYSYVTYTLKVFAIPQNWILDSQGVVRLKGIGYDSTEKWEAEIAMRLRGSSLSPGERAAKFPM